MKESDELVLNVMTPDRFPLTVQTVLAGLKEGVSPGIIGGVWNIRKPDQFQVLCSGQRRKIPFEQALLPETVFDLASLTKVMATATLTALLVDRRWLKWETPLHAILPQFASKEVTLSHLLSHTAGFVAWKPLWESLRAKFQPRDLSSVSIEYRQAAMRDLVLKIEPEVAPGERCVYSDISFLLLGFALEEVTQMPLDRAVQEWVWKPLGLKSMFFRRVNRSIEATRFESVAATENCPWRGGVLQGQVHDDNCWAMGGYGGHAGAFGKIRDIFHFVRGLMVDHFLSPSTLEYCWAPTKFGRTLGGWDLPSEKGSSTGQFFSKRSVGHLGFTGTSLWIDRDAGLAVALLTNRVHPSRENVLIREFRPRFHDAVRKDLVTNA